MPRFALLRHECPPDYRDGPHWDLMLERSDTAAEHRLATWSLLSLPGAWLEGLGIDREPATLAVETNLPPNQVPATQLPDHRAHYLDYEGPVSGGRGSVSRVAAGWVEWLELSESLCRFRLSGNSSLAGSATLEASAETMWHLSLS